MVDIIEENSALLITVQEISCALLNLVECYTISHRYMFKVREENLPVFIYRYFCLLFTKNSSYDTVKSYAVIKKEFSPHFLLRSKQKTKLTRIKNIDQLNQLNCGW